MSSERDLRTFAATWRDVGPLLEALRDRELRATPLPEAMDQLAGMIDSAVFLKPLSPTSGLVEMQRILTGLRA